MSLGSGLPLPQAMRLAGEATGSPLLGEDAGRLSDEVEQGHSVFSASQSARIIPPLFGFCVQVASGRDSLPLAVGQLAGAYERRAVQGTAMMKVILFPMLIIILGAILGTIIISLFLPLVHLINSVSSGG